MKVFIIVWENLPVKIKRMRTILIIASILLVSCNTFLNEGKTNRQILNQASLKGIHLSPLFDDSTQQVAKLDFEAQRKLIKKINNANYIGVMKAIPHYEIQLLKLNNDTLRIWTFRNYFKWIDKGDYTYKMNVNEHYIKDLLNAHQSTLLE